MGSPVSLGLIVGNICCWGIFFGSAPRGVSSSSKLLVLIFLIIVSFAVLSYRESYYYNRVVVRYLPFLNREVYWVEIQSFSLTPILRFRTVQNTIWLPGTPPTLQSFLDEHLRQIDRRGFVSVPTALLDRQLRYSAVWGAMFVLSVAATALFVAGGPLHKWWDSAGIILLFCDLQLLFAVLDVLSQTAHLYFSKSHM